MLKKYILLLFGFCILACNKQPRYPYYEGPVRMKLSIPFVMITNKSYEGLAFVNGEIPDVPMCMYSRMDNTEFGPRCADNLINDHRRTLSIPLRFDVEWWLFKKGWSRRMPGAHDTEVYDPLPLTEDAEEDFSSVKATVEVELWEVEPGDLPFSWKRVKRLAKVSHSAQVECQNDKRCIPPIR